MVASEAKFHNISKSVNGPTFLFDLTFTSKQEFSKMQLMRPSLTIHLDEDLFVTIEEHGNSPPNRSK